MARDDEDTHAFRAVDTQTYEAVDPGPPAPAGPPPGAWVEDVWPWLALLGVLALAAVLVWLFAFHDRHHAHRAAPNVVGLQQQVAIRRLQARGYSVEAVVGASKEPRGIVVSQSLSGSTMTLHVSNGRKPAVLTTTVATTTTTTAAATTAPAPTSQVPAVTNEDLVTAEGQVEAAGFVTEADPVGGGPAGTVTQQSPAAGSGAPAGSVVTIDVARGGGSAQVPDVVGRSASDARAALAQAKLTFKTVYKQGKAGIVLAETPTGTQPAYTQVVLTVGR